MIDLKNSDAQEILNQFSYAVNNLVFKVNQTAKEYSDSELMQDLDLCWIRILASPGYHTDLRNEESARVGKQLAAIPFVVERLKHFNNQKMEEVAKKMKQEHKTIQQSFSKLVFYHFLLTCNSKESQILYNKLGEDFYRLPLI